MVVLSPKDECLLVQLRGFSCCQTGPYTLTSRPFDLEVGFGGLRVGTRGRGVSTYKGVVNETLIQDDYQ